MEVNGTDVGLGFGAFITSVLAYLGFRPKKDDPMAELKKEIEEIKGRQNRFEEALHSLTELTKRDIKEINEDVKEMKEGVKEMSHAIQNIATSVTRLNTLYEVAANATKSSRHS